MRTALRKICAALVSLVPVCASDHKVETVAAVIWGEARGESDIGKIAVAEVIRNRVICRFASDPYAVVMQSRQFSCLEVVGRNELLAGLNEDPRKPFYVNLAKLLMSNGLRSKYANGATHFDRPGPKGLPLWSFKMKFCTKIGHHYFFREERR